MTNYRFTYIFSMLMFMIIVGCGNEGNNPYLPKPTALGKLNHIAVISEKPVWEGMVGDTFRYFYESAYPIMPQPESIFDLRFFTAEDLEAQPLRKELRTYIILCDLSDKESSTTRLVRRDLGEERYQKVSNDTTFTTTVGNDKWANGQLVIYLLGRNQDDLMENITKSFPAVAERIRKHDQKQLASNIYTLTKENTATKKKIRDLYGIELNLPGDYKESFKEGENFVILKKESQKYSQTIVIRAFPYRDKGQLSKQGMIDMRNEYGKAFITGSTSGSYMQTNVIDLPIYEYAYEINGAYTKEIRGIWELTDDYVGGPFISYGIVNEARKEIVFVDAFLYATGTKKRDYMQQLEYIIRNTKVVGRDEG